jgi:hypothetical protein
MIRFGAWLGATPGAIVVLVCRCDSLPAEAGPQRPAVVHAELINSLAQATLRVSGGKR